MTWWYYVESYWCIVAWIMGLIVGLAIGYLAGVHDSK